MNFNGITTIVAEKKWVFAYAVIALASYRCGSAQLVQVLTVLAPSVFALAGIDKYVKKDKQ